MAINIVKDESVLFITLDSLRFDTFESAAAPNTKAVAPAHKAQAPSYFTFGSHAAMFMGFTPGVANLNRSFLNPKWGKLFRLANTGFPGTTKDGFILEGESIVDGFNRLGYATIGSGAVKWFDNTTATGLSLTRHFASYFYSGGPFLDRQLTWIDAQISDAGNSRPVFVFLNIGETHIPYWHSGALWSQDDNPCVPFQSENRRTDCEVRQRLCFEYVDRLLGELFRQFWRATIVICADHGDCWGEEGLWEHGISHSATLTVPLLIRYWGTPIAADN